MIQSAITFNDFLIIGGDKGNIYIWNIIHQGNNKVEKCFQNKISFKAYKELRVKCLKNIFYDDIDYLITASTNGEVKVWDIL